MPSLNWKGSPRRTLEVEVLSTSWSDTANSEGWVSLSVINGISNWWNVYRLYFCTAQFRSWIVDVGHLVLIQWQSSAWVIESKGRPEIVDAETRSSNVDGYHYSGMICIAPKIWVHTVTRADCWAEKKILDNEQLTDEIDESYPQRIGWGGGRFRWLLLFLFIPPEKFNLRLKLRRAVGWSDLLEIGQRSRDERNEDKDPVTLGFCNQWSDDYGHALLIMRLWGTCSFWGRLNWPANLPIFFFFVS